MCYNVLVVIVIFVGIELSSYILLAHHHLAEKLGLYEVMKVVHIGHMNVIQNTDCARYDKGLFYTLNPGVCKFDSDAFKSTFSVEVKVNSQGTRDEEDRLKAPEIICIGDSHIMGWGVKQEESCPKLIERYTGKKTLNAGVSSYGTARELMLLSKLDRKN